MADQRRSGDRGNGLVPLGGGASRAGGVACGRVLLVGAGPGDPELLTLKALKALQSAAVVIHDRLTPPEILDLIPPGVRRLYVGKRKSHHSVPQDGINALLVGLAREGLEVVRLKGGDPFVFGRGGEELLACREAGVACEVIPGVSAGLAAAASAGAPVTHRGLAQSVTFVTGHARADGDGWAEPDLDWTALAKPNHTVVVYMGLSTAPAIAARLMQAGRSGATPAVIVENASRADERRVTTTVAGLAEAAAGLDGPAVLIIGEVAGLASAQDEDLSSPSPSLGRGQGDGGTPALRAATPFGGPELGGGVPPSPNPLPHKGGEGSKRAAR